MIHLLENLGTVIFSGEADCITINYEAKVYISFKIIVMFPLSKMNATLLAKLSIPLSVSFVLLSDNWVNLENDTSDDNRSLQLPCQV